MVPVTAEQGLSSLIGGGSVLLSGVIGRCLCGEGHWRGGEHRLVQKSSDFTLGAQAITTRVLCLGQLRYLCPVFSRGGWRGKGFWRLPWHPWSRSLRPSDMSG